MQQLISSILAMGIISVCDQCGETFKAYESDVSDSWDDYNTQLQEELGTTTLINGGYRYYFIIESITPSTDSMTVINAGTVGSYLISATYTASYTTRAIKYIFRPFTTSIPGYICSCCLFWLCSVFSIAFSARGYCDGGCCFRTFRFLWCDQRTDLLLRVCAVVLPGVDLPGAVPVPVRHDQVPGGRYPTLRTVVIL